MMSPAFLHWWHAPWEMDGAQPGFDATAPRDLLGRRDAYRHWCAGADIAPALPAGVDPRWTGLVELDAARLAHAARLLGGLFAARIPQPRALAGLDEDERRWCAGVANLQPLPRPPWRLATAREAGLAGVGLAWLALLLDSGFPGLWPRLRLGLAPGDRAGAARCLDDLGALPDAAAMARLARCWMLCVQRVR